MRFIAAWGWWSWARVGGCHVRQLALGGRLRRLVLLAGAFRAGAGAGSWAGWGEADLGAQAAAGLRADGEGGAVRMGDGLDDGQAEPEALAVAGAVGAKPLEGLQQPVHGGRRDDGPGVGHRQEGAGVPGAGEDLDGAAGRVVPQRVVGEVGDQA